MELLLTSAGVTNQAIAHKLTDLVGDGNKKVGFIPTASNAESGNKDWFFRQVTDLYAHGFDWIDVVDPSAPGVDWRARLGKVGVLFVSGGNTFHLLNQARKTGFDTWLKERPAHIVYVGASAGSILMTPNIRTALIDDADENLAGITDLRGLGFVDFEISPHTPDALSIQANEAYAATTHNKLYAYNDNSALCVTKGELEVIHDGQYWEFN